MAREKAVFSPKRAALHAPVGFLAALLLNWFPAVGWGLFIGFFIYEISEDWRIKDHAYIDIIGFLIGVGLTGAVLLACEAVS